jgi:hypothetical protein
MFEEAFSSVASFETNFRPTVNTPPGRTSGALCIISVVDGWKEIISGKICQDVIPSKAAPLYAV